MHYQLEGNGLRLTITADGALPPTAVLADLETGTAWGPAPVAVLECLSRGEQLVAPVRGLIPELRQDGDYIELRYAAERPGVVLVVQLRLAGGELIVTVPSQRIEQTNHDAYLLYGVDILPGLMRTDADAPGHLVLPIRNGAVCYPERHQRLRDAFLVYGEQHRWWDMPMLPCCGAVRTTSQAALLAIAESGECDAQCRVDLDGHGAGKTWFSFRYRHTPIDPVDPIDRRLRIVPLRGKDAGYQGMGRYLWRWIPRYSGRPPMAERAKTCPKLAYAASAYTLKIFHAHKDITHDGSGNYHVDTTFDQAIEQLRFLKAKGIERVWAQCVGWNLDGHDGCYPTRFPVDARLGGEPGFKRLLDAGRELGYQISVHDNYLDNYKRSPDWNSEDIVHTVYDELLCQGTWCGGQCHRSWADALPDSKLRCQLERVRDLGVDASYYIDAMGMPLELNYYPRYRDRGYRRACAEGIRRILSTAEDVFGSTGTEAGFLYVAAFTDSMGATYHSVDYDRNELADDLVPLWCMALRGHIFYSSQHLYAYAMGPGGKGMVPRLLELAELGMVPRTETTYVFSPWGVPVEAYADAIRMEYDLMLNRLEGLTFASLDDHRVVEGNPRQGNHVTESRYSNGTTIDCNWAEPSLTIDGEPWPLPTDWQLRPRGEIGHRP